MRSAANAFLTAAHVLTAVLGFGAVAVTGLQAMSARRSPARASVVRYFRPGVNWISLSLLLTPLLGGAIEAVNNYPDVHLLWPWLALAFWLVAAAVGGIVHWPAEREIQRRLAGALDQEVRAADPAALQRACSRAALSSAAMTAAFVAALVVMVAQPA